MTHNDPNAEAAKITLAELTNKTIDAMDLTTLAMIYEKRGYPVGNGYELAPDALRDRPYMLSYVKKLRDIAVADINAHLAVDALVFLTADDLKTIAALNSVEFPSKATKATITDLIIADAPARSQLITEIEAKRPADDPDPAKQKPAAPAERFGETKPKCTHCSAPGKITSTKPKVKNPDGTFHQVRHAKCSGKRRHTFKIVTDYTAEGEEIA